MHKAFQTISLTGTGARIYARPCTLQGGWRLFAASVKAAQFRQPPFRVLPTGSKQGARAALLSQSSTAPQPTGSKRRARAAILLSFRFVFLAMISSPTFRLKMIAERLKGVFNTFAFMVGAPAGMRPHYKSRLSIPYHLQSSLRLRVWRESLRFSASAKQHCASAYGLPTEGARCLTITRQHCPLCLRAPNRGGALPYYLKAALPPLPTGSEQLRGRPRRNQSGSAGGYAPAPLGVRPLQRSAPPCATRSVPPCATRLWACRRKKQRESVIMINSRAILS